MRDIANFSPLINDLLHYKGQWLPKDLIAGLSVAAVQVPTAVAYAQLAGFSPEIGLYASIFPVIIYGFLGSSRQLVVGPDAATCTMIASLIAPLASGDATTYVALSSGLSMCVGLLMIIGGITRMGFIVNFFARPILIGFLNGIAASIIVGQTGKLLGIALKKTDFLPQLMELISRINQTHLITFAVGATTLALLIVLKRLAPRAPSSLIALVIATLGLQMLGSSSSGVALVGNVPAGLPHLVLPTFGYAQGQGLLVGAFGLVIVSFTSGMLTARSFAARSRETIDANREMWALGVANLAAGFSGSFAITGADSRTAVNAASGSKTQLSSVFAALATAAVAVWLSSALACLPLSALAAVLIFSALQLIDVSSYKELKRIDPFDFRLSILTTIGVLALGVLPGVATAIVMALIVIMVRLYKPSDTILGVVPNLEGYNDLSLSSQSKSIPGVLIWRFEGPLVFFNADYFKKRVQEHISQTSPKVLILSLESVSQLDATGVKAIEELIIELDAQNIKLLFARPKTYMQNLIEKTTLSKYVSSKNVFPTIHTALDSIDGNVESATADVEFSSSFHAFYNLEAQNEQSESGENTPR